MNEGLLGYCFSSGPFNVSNVNDQIEDDIGVTVHDILQIDLRQVYLQEISDQRLKIILTVLCVLYKQGLHSGCRLVVTVIKIFSV